MHDFFFLVIDGSAAAFALSVSTATSYLIVRWLWSQFHDAD